MSAAITGWEWAAAGPWTVAGLAVLLAATVWSLGAAWRRLLRRSTPRWLLVSALNLVAALALAALLAPPVQLRPADAAVSLLTEGATEGEGLSAASVFAAPGADSPDLPLRVERLAHVGQLPLRRPAIGSLDVLGYGLEATQWAGLPDDIDVAFQPPPLEGITDAAWARRLDIGQPLVVEGRFSAPQADTVATVKLLDPSGQVAAETSVRSGATFRLIARPRAGGLFIYRLVLERGGETVADEPLPVESVGGEAARIGVIQSAPSFETRQLQDWAGGEGSRLVVHTQISRDRYIAQGVNTGPGEASEFTPALLDGFDLLVMDGRSWLGLGAPRRGWIESAVRDGLGLLVLADGDLANAFGQIDRVGDGESRLLDGFTLTAVDTPPESVVPSFPGLFSETALPLLGPRLQAPAATPLVVDEDGQPLEAWLSRGMGRVALSVLRERHGWLTGGERDAYTAYWAHLLRELGRSRSGPRLTEPAPDARPTPRLKHRLCANSDGRALRVTITSLSGSGDGEWTSDLELVRATVGGPLGCAHFWPGTSGWHRLDLRDAESGETLATRHLYVFATDSWRHARRQARIQTTLARVARNPDAGTTPPDDRARQARTPLGPGWPWWLFVVSASLLWLERKLDEA